MLDLKLSLEIKLRKINEKYELSFILFGNKLFFILRNQERIKQIYRLSWDSILYQINTLH